MKLGISLSGGGVRATVFHLGALARLAETELWGNIAHISTVSGGSLCVALIFEKSGRRWPGGEEYLHNILRRIQQLLNSFDLERAYKVQTLTHPWRLLHGRAHVLGSLMQKYWGINSNVADMPLKPRWTINATCYETGKNWRFSAKRMGDYVANYVMKPEFPLADAIAASAAVPGLIGPLRLDTNWFRWQKYENGNNVDVKPIASSLHLWDGGIYDNLGLEVLYKMGKGLRSDLDYCLVFDASKPVGRTYRPRLPFVRFGKQAIRLIDITTDQIRSLRAREAFAFFRERKCGGYLRIGESVRTVFAHLEYKDENTLFNSCLNEQDVMAAATFNTTLRAIAPKEFLLMLRHGYETCNAVLVGSLSEPFQSFRMEKWERLFLADSKE